MSGGPTEHGQGLYPPSTNGGGRRPRVKADPVSSAKAALAKKTDISRYCVSVAERERGADPGGRDPTSRNGPAAADRGGQNAGGKKKQAPAAGTKKPGAPKARARTAAAT